MCRAEPRRRVHTIDAHRDSEYDVNLDQLFIDGIDTVAGKDCFADISIEGLKVKVKLDTGAQTSVMPFALYQKPPTRPHIHSSSVTLKAYGGHQVSHKGKANLCCQTENSEGTFEFYIVESSAPPIL